jgi:hypothetical protein
MTLEGVERIRLAVAKHGQYSRAAKAERQLYRMMLRNFRQLLAAARRQNQAN